MSHLLFGFPHVSADSFVHPYDQLRIGGTLRHSDGDRLEFVRRKGNRNTLRGPDDSAIVPDERLTRFLGGLNEDTFKTLFGIDHERLTRAGEEIRTGQGQLGELLFAAGAGLAGLRRAQETLQGGLDKLFKPRAQHPRINKGLTEFRDAQEELKQHQLPSEEWQQHDRAHHEALEESERLRTQIRAARGEQGRLKRIKSGIPIVARRRRLLQAREELGDAIRLRDDFGSEFRQAQDQLRLAEQTIDQARAAIAELDAQLTQLDPPQVLLDAADEIGSLRERLGAVEKANEDRAQRLEIFLRDAEHEARRLLRDLGRPIDLDEAETLRLRADEPVIIRRLGQQFAELHGQAEEARRTIARHDDQIRRQEKDLADLVIPRDVEPLRRAVRQARKAGDLDTRLTEARGKLARAEKKAATALAQLPGWSRSAEVLQGLAVPLNATIDLYETRFQDLTRERQIRDERLAAEDDAIRDLETRLQSLELQHDVPTEEALLAVRTRREQGWRLVKAAWLDGGSEGELINPFLAEFAPGGPLASAYEQSVWRGDELADRLRREADRVARKAEWLAQIDEHRGLRTALEREGQLLDDRRASLDREWRSLTSPLGIESQAGTPVELRAWLRRREEVLQLVEKRDEARHAVEPLENEMTRQCAVMSKAQAEVGESFSAGSGSELSESLEQAELIIKRQDDLGQKRTKLETKLAAARSERDTAQLSLQAAETALDGWKSDWSVKMARLGLDAGAAPEQAEVFLTKIGELQEKLNDRRSHQSRIRGIERDADQFATDVAALASRVAPDLADHLAGEAARALAGRLRDAQADDQKRVTLTEHRQRAEASLRAGESQSSEARIRLERLCQEAGCTAFDQVSEAERRSQDRARIESDLAACEEQLLVVASGADPASFAADVEQADPDALDLALEELEARISDHEDALRRVDQTIGTERGELARMNSGAGAADSAEKAQTILAQLQGDIARYATLKLAAGVLHRSIERYREKNQGPILARAGALFAALTGGSFARLQIDDDGDGHSILKGVRPDGRLVSVNGMSDGSHDQLYLAPPAGQPGSVAPGPRADPVHRQRHPAELRRPPRHRRPCGPGRALPATPRSSSSRTTAT